MTSSVTIQATGSQSNVSIFSYTGTHTRRNIVFKTRQILVHSSQFSDTQWNMTGDVSEDSEGVEFTGRAASATKPGFGLVFMRPMKSKPHSFCMYPKISQLVNANTVKPVTL